MSGRCHDSLCSAALLALLLSTGCRELEPPTAPEAPAASAAAASRGAAHSELFIVTLSPGRHAADVAQRHGVAPHHTYTHVLNGFAAALPAAALRGLRADGQVLRIERDGMLHFNETVQRNATWGIDRIDQRALPLSGDYRYELTGRGVSAYIMDTGIRFSHAEFEGRAVLGRDFALEDEPETTDPNQGPGEDCYGHGTHVAGTVGGRLYGVAKEVRLVSVRMSGCTGFFPISRGLAALDWITADHLERRAADPLAGSVVNMSFGATFGDSFDDAIRAMIAVGVAAAVSAGNANQEDGACGRTPSRIAEAMTVGASDREDLRSSFSNWGGCVDWFAPGTGITSAGFRHDTEAYAMNGTSMSAPHTAGVAALFLQANPGATPAEVMAGLATAATPDAILVHREPVYHHRSGRLIGYNDTYGNLLYSRVGLAQDPDWRAFDWSAWCGGTTAPSLPKRAGGCTSHGTRAAPRRRARIPSSGAGTATARGTSSRTAGAWPRQPGRVGHERQESTPDSSPATCAQRGSGAAIGEEVTN
jgi:subtilisin family serine protease